MGAGLERVHEKIRLFKKKYYLNIFIRGTLISILVVLSYFLIAALLEYNLWLSPWIRFAIVLTFVVVVMFCLYRFLKEPIQWWFVKRGLDEEQSAKVIGNYLPKAKDRLLNLIQLSSHKNKSSLLFASLDQKSHEFETISFDAFIDLKNNRRYARYLLIPFSVMAIILFLNQSILTQSANRIVHFNRQYSPTAPFNFIISKGSLDAFYNENFVLQIKLAGAALPENAYLIAGQQRLKFEHLGSGEFAYTFENIQNGFDFQVEAAGFFSEVFSVNLINRPELGVFNVELEFPAYLARRPETLTNTGNLDIPEGTRIMWLLSATNTGNARIHFSPENGEYPFQNGNNQQFSYSKEVRNHTDYEIILQNDKSRNREKITYHINVNKDEYPKIQVNPFEDSVLYKVVVLSGLLSDDYGIRKLDLHFAIRNEESKEKSSGTIPLSVLKNQSQQSFFMPWVLDSLKLQPGDQLEYYLEVWDNDGVNGSKSTKTSAYTFLVPTEENLVAEIRSSQSKTQQKIDQSVGKANKLQQQIDQVNQKLKGKKSLDWQDKKMLEDIVTQEKNLSKLVEELRDQNKLLEQKKEAFTEQDERIREKAEQIQKLMDELLDEETKKLFEELQKLLKENSDLSQIQKILDKLNQNTNNLEKELERTLELFKQLQYEFKLDQAINNLKEQVAEQKSLLEKTEALEKNTDKSEKNKGQQKGEDKDSSKEDSAKENEESQELAEEQKKLSEEFENTSEKIDELKELGEQLQQEDDLPTDEDVKDVQQQQEESQEMLKQNSPSKAKSPQSKALQKMQKMQQQMEGAENSMSMEIDMKNLETLRQIIHGLVKLSFDEEGLMKSFNELNQNDPGFNGIAQRQIKLKDDAKVLEDSLLALGKRDPFMGSIVTREVGELNEHLDKVIEANRERRRPQASNEMQMTMTSINNLALMLDDHFDMMMEMMANAQPSMGKSKKKGQKPSLSQMQQQLNEKIQELKGSGKSGRELSEELAEMAAEQERIRRALQEMQEKMKDGKMPGGDLPSRMEQTEMDLLNKQLTDQLIRRQQEIITRLLETEKSAREQEMDEERKGETAEDYSKQLPKAFEEYLRLKEKEVELLKSVPPKLYPYYKKEVNEYFKRVGEN